MKTKQKITKKLPAQTGLKHRTKLILVPHKANQYRPHLVRRYGLLVVLVLVFGLQAGYNYSTTGSVLGSGAQMAPAQLVETTNEQRVNNQLPPLKQSDQLTRAAYLKAQDMVSDQYWAHEAPDGTTPWYWLGEVNYNYTHAGENLARGFRTAEATTTAWMSSAEHQANILNPDYSEVGFAVVDGMLDGKATTLVVALYGAPAEMAVAGVAQTAAAELPADRSMSPVTRLGVAVSSFNPAVVGSMMIMMMTSVVAMMAHFYRNKLPKALRQTWYRHHGVIKTGCMLSVLIVIFVLYSGGQI